MVVGTDLTFFRGRN